MTIFFWLGFLLLIGVLLALDLGVFNKTPHAITSKEAFTWTAVWVILSVLFNIGIYFIYENNWIGLGTYVPTDLTGAQASLQFFSAYLLEKTLSLDNVFVIALIFEHFKTPLHLQHRVLAWGVMGAIFLRFIMISAGMALLHQFYWLTYIFGILLIFTAVKMLLSSPDKIDPETNLLVKGLKKLFPISNHYYGKNFFIKQNGKKIASQLFIVLLFIESSDLIFAIDSIPAVFAVSMDTFIIFTSNIFAILGLRSLYFALANSLAQFRYLKTSLVFLLTFVGIKMLLSHSYPIPTIASLAFIVGILSIGIIASLLAPRENSER